MKLKSILITAIILVFSISSSNTANEKLSWLSFNDGMKKAVSEKKILIVDFYTEWCGWCKKMDSETYTDDDVINYLKKNYVLVKLNPEKDGAVQFQGKKYEAAEFAGAAGVKGYPAIGFFTHDQEFITLVPGYKNATDFLELIKLVDNRVKELNGEKKTGENLNLDLDLISDLNPSTLLSLTLTLTS